MIDETLKNDFVKHHLARAKFINKLSSGYLLIMRSVKDRLVLFVLELHFKFRLGENNLPLALRQHTASRRGKWPHFSIL